MNSIKLKEFPKVFIYELQYKYFVALLECKQSFWAVLRA